MTDNIYKPADIRLDSLKTKIWLLSLLGCGIYAIIVILILYFAQISVGVETVIIYSYIFIAPLTLYAVWMAGYIWKSKKWHHNEEIYGGRIQNLLLFLLLGVCVINWASFWNSGLDVLWLAAAMNYYILTNDIFWASVIYAIGAYAVTPALVEEFLKSLPFILAYFVILQRNRNSEQKGKGMLGNELNGFLLGILIGIVFEIIELSSYVISTIVLGGSTIDIYRQVTIRNWAPIHIMGAAIGGFAAGRAERLRFELGEENLPMKTQVKKFLKRFLPFWFIPVLMHFTWNSSGIWIFLIVLAVNGDMVLFETLSTIVYVGLSIISFVILLIYFRKANKIAENMYRCPETGIIVAREGIVCKTFSDTPSSKTVDINIKLVQIPCPKCGRLSKRTHKFCTKCGFNFIKKRKRIKLYNGHSMRLIIFSLIFIILFLIFNSILTVLLLSAYVGIALLILITQISVVIITVGLTIYAIITLLKLRKKYRGYKSIWGWLILILNLIGMIGTFLFLGIAFLIFGLIAIIIGEFFTFLIQTATGFHLLLGAAILFILIIFGFLKGEQTLQYERKF